MVTSKNQESPKADELKASQDNEEKEYKIAIDVLNKYKGKKVQDFDSTSKILEIMTGWENAWESQNMEVCKAYYDESFIGVSVGKTMNYYQWIDYKRELFNRYDRIGVYTALVDATLQGNNLKVEFEQYIINIHSPLKVVNYNGERIARLIAKHNNYKVVGDIGYPMPGSLGTYFGKEKNISVITLENSPEDGDVAWKENKDGIYE